MNSFLVIGELLWIHKDGRTYSVPVSEASQARKGAAQKNSSGLLKSPMPGKILKVAVKRYDEVKAGQTICVIEAMKMEYALKAPFGGIVKELFKNVNELVVLDEKVAVIAEEKDQRED